MPKGAVSAREIAEPKGHIPDPRAVLIGIETMGTYRGRQVNWIVNSGTTSYQRDLAVPYTG